MLGLSSVLVRNRIRNGRVQSCLIFNMSPITGTTLILSAVLQICSFWYRFKFGHNGGFCNMKPYIVAVCLFVKYKTHAQRSPSISSKMARVYHTPSKPCLLPKIDDKQDDLCPWLLWIKFFYSLWNIRMNSSTDIQILEFTHNPFTLVPYLGQVHINLMKA